MICLINHPATAAYVPLATLRNFQAAVHDVGKAMDKESDVLVLFVTSHGDRKGVALQLPNQVIDLTPQDVAAAFARDGIKNRVVIVPARFSGIFVPPLQNANTIVLTAADATIPRSAARRNETGPISAMRFSGRRCGPALIFKARFGMPEF